MKKAIFALLLLAGANGTVAAQQSASTPAAISATSGYDPVQFKEKSFGMERALRNNDYAAARQMLPEVQRMMSQRADNFRFANKTAEEKNMRELMAKMKTLSQSMESNKEKLLLTITATQAQY